MENSEIEKSILEVLGEEGPMISTEIVKSVHMKGGNKPRTYRILKQLRMDRKLIYHHGKGRRIYHALPGDKEKLNKIEIESRPRLEKILIDHSDLIIREILSYQTNLEGSETIVYKDKEDNLRRACEQLYEIAKIVEREKEMTFERPWDINKDEYSIRHLGKWLGFYSNVLDQLSQ